MKPWLVALCLVGSFFLAAMAYLATFWLAFSKEGGSDFIFSFWAHVIFAVPAGLLGVFLSAATLKLYPKHGLTAALIVGLAAGALFVPLIRFYQNAQQQEQSRRFYAGVAEQGEKNLARLETFGLPKLTIARYEGRMFPPEGTSIVLDTDLSLEDAAAHVRSQVPTWDEMKLGSKSCFGRLVDTGEIDRIVVYGSGPKTQILVQRVPADALLHTTVEPFARLVQSKMWDRATGLLSPEYEREIGGAEGIKSLVEKLPPMSTAMSTIQIGANTAQSQWASYAIPTSLHGKDYLFVAVEKESGLWRVFKLAPTDWKGAHKLNRELGREPST